MSTSAVALIQSYAIEYLDTLFTSIEIRDLLVSTGIPQGSGGHIGPLPNIKAAIEKLDSLYTGIENKRLNQNIKTLGLIYANSFIHYFVPEIGSQKKGNVRINLYNLKGAHIKTLINEQNKPGKYKIKLNSRNTFSPGLYLCKFNVGTLKRAIKLMVK